MNSNQQFEKEAEETIAMAIELLSKPGIIGREESRSKSEQREWEIERSVLIMKMAAEKLNIYK